MEYADAQSIGALMRERNIELATLDPVARGGFTQLPNFILRDGTLSLGAKVAYSIATPGKSRRSERVQLACVDEQIVIIAVQHSAQKWPERF